MREVRCRFHLLHMPRRDMTRMLCWPACRRNIHFHDILDTGFDYFHDVAASFIGFRRPVSSARDTGTASLSNLFAICSLPLCNTSILLYLLRCKAANLVTIIFSFAHLCFNFSPYFHRPPPQKRYRAGPQWCYRLNVSVTREAII